MILITTPTGDIGARVLSNVLDAGEKVRVILRDASKLDADTRGRVDIVEGSHADGGAIARALEGVSAVFWLPPGSLRAKTPEDAYVDFSRAFCTALPGSSVSHIVGVSALGRGWPKPAGLAAASIAMDDMIAATGVAYCSLACASLMDNIARQIGLIREQGAFYQPTPGDLKLPHVAKADVAAIASRLLIGQDWDSAAELALCGPEDLSFEEMARVLSDVLGREIAFHEMSVKDFDGVMRGVGASEGMAQGYVEMMTAKNEGMDNAACPKDRSATPTTFRTWCETELLPSIQAQ
ncbi:NAD(P)H-binding protein [Roseovarius mucosus]|uniref:NAD(P)H-binding protein n=1 Tax=Roseovarius mucosus TaxID=215743 RepID=UPI003BAB06B5